jgi:hypothetical protein
MIKSIDIKTITLTGRPFKECGKCEEMCPPEGGIEVSAIKWLCASCWAIRNTRYKSK